MFEVGCVDNGIICPHKDVRFNVHLLKTFHKYLVIEGDIILLTFFLLTVGCQLDANLHIIVP